jgi:SAM-dependent methyltransferase
MLNESISHDLSLHSGERQTATSYGLIRADHRYRYEWASERIPENVFGLDVFCGNGYGAWFLGDKRFIIGIDGSQAAIELANEYFKKPKVLFVSAYYPFDLPKEKFDFVVALESIEHIEKGNVFFETICNSLKPGGDLIFSTPCEDILPHRGTGNHFHYKHYTLEETLRLANSNGLSLISYAGQDTYYITSDGLQGDLLPDSHMTLKPNSAGQFIIVHSRKKTSYVVLANISRILLRLSKFSFRINLFKEKK